MTNWRAFIRVLSDYTGRTSEKEISEYELYFKNRSALSSDLAERIEKEYSEFIAKKHPELAVKIAEVLQKGEQYDASRQSLQLETIVRPEETRMLKSPGFYAEQWYDKMNKEEKIIASSGDIYTYLHMLCISQNTGSHKDAHIANKRLKEFLSVSRPKNKLMTSTRIFYQQDHSEALVVHHYGIPLIKPTEIKCSIPESERAYRFRDNYDYPHLNECGKQPWLGFMQAIFNTKDDFGTISKVLSAAYGPDADKIVQIQIRPKQYRARECQLLFSDCYLISCSIDSNISLASHTYYWRLPKQDSEADITGDYYAYFIGSREIISIKKDKDKYLISAPEWTGIGKLEGDVLKTEYKYKNGMFKGHHVMKISDGGKKLGGKWNHNDGSTGEVNWVRE